MEDDKRLVYLSTCQRRKGEGYTGTQLSILLRSIIHGTMTVDELRERLLDFPSDWPVFISNDNGYSYGAVSEIVDESYETEGTE